RSRPRLAGRSRYRRPRWSSCEHRLRHFLTCCPRRGGRTEFRELCPLVVDNSGFVRSIIRPAQTSASRAGGSMQRFWRWLSRLLCAALLVCAPMVRAADDKKSEEPPDPAADINSPRSDSRKIEFETFEGTWMSVDIAPDGRTLIFDLLGDIYAL